MQKQIDDVLIRTVVWSQKIVLKIIIHEVSTSIISVIISFRACYVPKLANFMYKGISMLATWKMSSLSYKCVFCRPENNTNEGPSRKWILKVLKCKHEKNNECSSKSQWKNGIICLVIMFAAGVMVIKMLKMSHFLYFLLMLAKSYSKFEESVYVYLKDLI